MTPLKLKKFLSSRHQASVEEIKTAFGIGSGLALALLGFWIKRGFCVEITACESCNLCDIQYYQWRNPCTKP